MTSAFVMKPVKTAGHDDTTLCRPYGGLGAVERNQPRSATASPLPTQASMTERNTASRSALQPRRKKKTQLSILQHAPQACRARGGGRLSACVFASLMPFTWQPLRAQVSWQLRNCFCRPRWRQLPSSFWATSTEPRSQACPSSSPRSRQIGRAHV